MRKFLSQGSHRFEILSEYESVVRFCTVEESLAFLRKFKNDAMQMAALRESIAAHCQDAHRLDNDQVLKRFAELLVTGRKVMIRRFPSVKSSSSSQPEKEQKSEGREKVKPSSSSWIEINLKDGQGNLVGGERYRIRLPDGSVQEGSLDDFGHAEHYGINKGSCEISFPDLDDEEWSRV